MSITPDKIIAYVSKSSYRTLRPRDLAKEMKIPENQYRRFKNLIKELVANGELVRIRGGRIGPPEKMNLKVGIIQITRQGFGFLKPEDKTDEIYIRTTDTKTALNRDKVVVRIKPSKSGKKQEGEVIQVLERATEIFVGTYHSTKFYEYLEPDDPSFRRDIYILPDHGLHPKEGQKIALVLSEWKNQFLNPEGKLIEVIGFPDEPGVDILTVIKKYNLPTVFPPRVEHEAEKIKFHITPAELKRRKDFRDKIVFTIDPADAKDFDDALSLEIMTNGNYLLGVHIADVAHYVKENSVVDKEARNRATSVYLVDRVLPMLPENLSNNICSLREKVDRFTYTCQMEITPRGKIENYNVFNSVINSNARLNYDEVQDFFDNGKSDSIPQEVQEVLPALRKLAKIKRQKRFKAGSLDFDLPEAQIVLDSSGKVVDIKNRVRKESHRLVEEFMLLANRCTAHRFLRVGLPTLYRVHDQPDEDKIRAFIEFTKSLGYDFKISPPIKPKQLADCLKKIAGQPEEELLNEIMLRSLKKAQYQRKNIGHFGLAYDHYLHFTSPIRRYPDLMIHRLLNDIKGKQYKAGRAEGLIPLLDKLGSHCSDMEVIAEKAERESIKIKQVLYLSNRIGELFEGIITGITSGGFFVRLMQFSAEGMVRLSSMNDDYYFVDMDKYMIQGRHTRKKYRLGDKVSVQISKVDLAFNRIDLILEEKAPVKKIQSKSKPKRSRRSRRRNG